MMEFKIGDTVKVKTDLFVGNTYGYNGLCFFAKDMEKYKGKIYTIIDHHREDRYTLSLEHDESWEFTHDMLELVESEHFDSEDLLKTALQLLEMNKSELITIFKKSNEINNLKHDIHLKFVERDCGIECQSCEYKDYLHCEIAFTIDELAKKDLLNLD